MKAVRKVLRPFWNPIIEKELRSRMRTGRASLLISLYLLTLAAVGYFTYLVVRRQASGGVTNGQLSVNAGSTIFRALTVWELILIVFVAPALTATAIAGERDRQTLDLLLCTRVRPSTISVGKLFSSLLFALLLLIASVPIFSMVFLFGGVELPQVSGVAVILGVTAVVVGAIGLLCSTALRRPTAATVFAYVIAFLYVTVPIGTSVIWPASPGFTSVQQYVQIANPAFAIASTLLDTPVRSPTAPSTTIVTSPTPASGPSGFAQVCSGGGGGPVVCSSTPLNSQVLPATITKPAPETDRIQAGLFKAWPIWQAYTFVSAIVVIIVVGCSVATLSRRDARVGRRGRRRRKGSPGSPGGSGSGGGGPGGSGPGGTPEPGPGSGHQVELTPAAPVGGPELADVSRD